MQCMSVSMQNKLVSNSFSEAEISTLDLKCNSQRDKHISETNKTQIFWATIGNRCVGSNLEYWVSTHSGAMHMSNISLEEILREFLKQFLSYRLIVRSHQRDIPRDTHDAESQIMMIPIKLGNINSTSLESRS